MSTKKMEGKNDKENEPSQNRSLHRFTLANLYLAFLLIQEVTINLLKNLQMPPYARVTETPLFRRLRPLSWHEGYVNGHAEVAPNKWYRGRLGRGECQR